MNKRSKPQLLSDSKCSFPCILIVPFYLQLLNVDYLTDNSDKLPFDLYGSIFRDLINANNGLFEHEDD